MELREDQKYDLTTSENEAWVVGRSFGATTLLTEAMKEITSVGGSVLLVCPMGACLNMIGHEYPLKQDTYSVNRGLVTYLKGFMKIDPNDYDLILIDHIFHLDAVSMMQRWRELTESNTKVILAGTPSEGHTRIGCIEENLIIKNEIDCFYKLHSGSTFHNSSLPDVFLEDTLKSGTNDILFFKREVLGIC